MSRKKRKQTSQPSTATSTTSEEFFEVENEKKAAQEIAANKVKLVANERPLEWYKSIGRLNKEITSMPEVTKTIGSKLYGFSGDIAEFQEKANAAKRNVQANIDTQKKFLEDTKNFKKESYSELRTRFSNEEVKNLQNFESGWGYRKAQLLDKGKSMLNSLSFGRFGSQSSIHTQEYQKGILDGAMDSKRSVARAEVAKNEKTLKAIEANNGSAVYYSQTAEGAARYSDVKARLADRSKRIAEKKSGLNLKGKTGAIAGGAVALLALGGVIGNMFAGGHRSNAELYNPNGYSQYYS